MNRKDAVTILKAAGATDLQVEQFVGRGSTISAVVVAGAIKVLKKEPK